MSDFSTRVGQLFKPSPILPYTSKKRYYGDEEYADIASQAWGKAPSVADHEEAEVVDGKPLDPLMALSISTNSKRLIAEVLRSELEGRYRSHSDEDGFKFSVVWGLLDIEAIHHYTWNDLYHRHDSNIEVVGVYDMDGEALPGLVAELKKYI